MPKATKPTRNAKTATTKATETLVVGPTKSNRTRPVHIPNETKTSPAPGTVKRKTGPHIRKPAPVIAKPAPLARKPAEWEGLQTAAECLRVLAHPHRLRMIQLLLLGRFSVGELANDCGLPSNVASEHLRLMQRCGFLESQRESRNVYYRIREPHLATIMQCIETRFLTSSESS